MMLGQGDRHRGGNYGDTCCRRGQTGAVEAGRLTITLRGNTERWELASIPGRVLDLGERHSSGSKPLTSLSWISKIFGRRIWGEEKRVLIFVT